MASDVGFYRGLPLYTSFDDMTRAENYTPLPDDWSLGAADVVGSTAMIEQGRYKVVNTIGAGVVCAQINALASAIGTEGSGDLPFVFGGDGAVFAVPAQGRAASRRALAATVHWAHDAWGAELRAAMASVGDLRAAGHDVRVARMAPQEGSVVAYAMFEGGGARYLENEMKRGRYAIAPGDPTARPDLSGLSCRWDPIRSQHGAIVSLLVVPEQGAAQGELDRLYARIDAIVQGLDRAGHPVPTQGPRWPVVARNLQAEWHATRHDRSFAGTAGRLAHVVAENAFAWGLDRLGRKAGRFDPRHYARVLSENSDFRKISDGLMMTIDCDPATLRKLRRVLDRARAKGLVRYGVSEQEEAIVTCIVPSAVADDHIHFVDGAKGGYTLAAAGLEG